MRRFLRRASCGAAPSSCPCGGSLYTPESGAALHAVVRRVAIRVTLLRRTLMKMRCPDAGTLKLRPERQRPREFFAMLCVSMW